MAPALHMFSFCFFFFFWSWNQPAEPSWKIAEQDLQVPKKRAIALMARWKTLEQIRSNFLKQYGPNNVKESQQLKYKKPSPSTMEDIVQMPGRPKDFITAVARGFQRSLRPPGQPLRWG